jgi:hypothetical protein
MRGTARLFLLPDADYRELPRTVHKYFEALTREELLIPS